MHPRRLDTSALLAEVGGPGARRAHWTSEVDASPLTFEGVEVRPGELLALGDDGRNVWLSWTKDDAELMVLEIGSWKHERVRDLLTSIAQRSFEHSKGDVFVRVGHARHWVGHEVVLRRHGVLS